MWGLRTKFAIFTSHLPVHPHVCGVYCVYARVHVRVRGSSPRVWGLRSKSAPGNIALGSSPRVWGLLALVRRFCSHLRFIPTCVGFTHFPVVSQSIPARFIPTCVGFTQPRTMRCIFRCGSSPRVWGLPAHGWQTEILRRFIPTCVGFTQGQAAMAVRSTRFIPTCVGFTHGFRPKLFGKYGSSPRVWGLPFQTYKKIELLRFIPTCVGFTGLMKSVSFIVYGSSPRVWGLLSSPFHALYPFRFIPTCVGFTPLKISTQHNRAVHPHVCGVYNPALAVVASIAGSSPRVWGLLLNVAISLSVRTVHPHVCGVYGLEPA